MEYGKVVERSVNIVWQNKYLILLGILVALGSGTINGGGGGGGGSSNGNGSGIPGQFPEFGEEIAGLAIGAIVLLACLALFVGLLFWAISTIARGGLIASVDAIESGQKSSFGDGWRAGRERVWSLLGIGLLPGIPGIILLLFGLMGLAGYGSISAISGGTSVAQTGFAGFGGLLALVACIAAPLILVLSILRTFAERACMLEDLGVIEAYRRGWQVLTANLGEAIVLFLVQIAIFILLGIALFLPGIIVILCCLLWPLFLVASGAASAFVSTLWTLAWRDWTGRSAKLEKALVEI